MTRVSPQSYRMATAAAEYCQLIDGFGGLGHENTWMERVGKMLPRLHVAVIALVPSGEIYSQYRFPDDDERCELYMRLHHLLELDRTLKLVYGKSHLRQQSCDRLADDFTDMYFDLKFGLDLLESDPEQAINVWQCSFYIHWGQHLLDAECRLNAVEAGKKPLHLCGWNWPSLSFAGV
jgi:hypothetical protein